MKVLSIVVPIYNVEKYLKRCLDSICVSEVLSDIEVILVNDGSKDNSIKIMKEYEKKYPNTIILIDKENGGHGSTINAGLKIARGKYFRVIDSDDWVNSIDFIKFVKDLKESDADLVVTNHTQELIFASTNLIVNYEELTSGQVYDFDSFDFSVLKDKYFPMAGSTYKTEVLKKSNLKLMEKTFYVDMQYNIIPIKEVNTFVYFDYDIYKYFIGRKDQSMNIDNFVRNVSHHDKVVKYLIDYYEENKDSYSDNKRYYISNILTLMLNTHYHIYVEYDKNKNTAVKNVKKFDSYLKEKSITLYNNLNRFSIIKYHRKFNFYTVNHLKVLKKVMFVFSKLIKKGEK